MCGIAGFWDRGRPADEAGLRALAERMIAPIDHRGPDSAGVWADAAAGVGFGHRRLAIVDLTAAGHQPMLSASGRSAITYNGEIYNAAEIRPWRRSPVFDMIDVRLATRSGRRIAIVWAIIPPIDTPTTWARSTSRWSSRPSASSAMSASR